MQTWCFIFVYFFETIKSLIKIFLNARFYQKEKSYNHTSVCTLKQSPWFMLDTISHDPLIKFVFLHMKHSVWLCLTITFCFICLTVLDIYWGMFFCDSARVCSESFTYHCNAVFVNCIAKHWWVWNCRRSRLPSKTFCASSKLESISPTLVGYMWQ